MKWRKKIHNLKKFQIPNKSGWIKIKLNINDENENKWNKVKILIKWQIPSWKDFFYQLQSSLVVSIAYLFYMWLIVHKKILVQNIQYFCSWSSCHYMSKKKKFRWYFEENARCNNGRGTHYFVMPKCWLFKRWYNFFYSFSACMQHLFKTILWEGGDFFLHKLQVFAAQNFMQWQVHMSYKIYKIFTFTMLLFTSIFGEFSASLVCTGGTFTWNIKQLE